MPAADTGLQFDSYQGEGLKGGSGAAYSPSVAETVNTKSGHRGVGAEVRIRPT